MNTEYKHIHFVKMADTPKTSVWECRNNISYDKIGEVKWYSTWRRYCYLAESSVYSVGCLKDIIDFINQVNTQRKNETDK